MSEQSNREVNVEFAHDVLDAEIQAREERKRSVETAGRGVLVATGATLSLLLGAAGNAGLFSSDAPTAARIGLFLIVLVGAASAICSIGALIPRDVDRLKDDGLDKLKEYEFLDQDPHDVRGSVTAPRVKIAKSLDDQHEEKVRWLKWSFRILAALFVLLAIEAGILVAHPHHAAGSGVTIDHDEFVQQHQFHHHGRDRVPATPGRSGP